MARVLEARERFECPLASDGQTRHLEIDSYPMTDRTGKAIGKALLIRDISEKKALIEQLERTASTDELTGVCNRRHLMELSTRAFALAQRHQSSLSVMIVDVDHFKAINDRQGHLAGDALLRQIATLLSTRLRATDILGRYGGDEFIITLPQTDARHAGELARALAHACHTECGATLSVGVAERQATTHDLSTLLGLADEALYRAKAAGRDQVSVHMGTTPTDFAAPPATSSSPLTRRVEAPQPG